jgi:hypothetical protein
MFQELMPLLSQRMLILLEAKCFTDYRGNLIREVRPLPSIGVVKVRL